MASYFHQLYAVCSYFLSKLLHFTILLTIILSIKTDFTLAIFGLLFSQCLELSCESLFVRFPVSIDYRIHYKLLMPIFYFVFVVSHILMICSSIYVMENYVNNNEYALSIIVLTRSLIMIFSFIVVTILVRTNEGFGNGMRSECRKLMQILLKIYPNETQEEASIL